MTAIDYQSLLVSLPVKQYGVGNAKTFSSLLQALDWQDIRLIIQHGQIVGVSHLLNVTVIDPDGRELVKQRLEIERHGKVETQIVWEPGLTQKAYRGRTPLSAAEKLLQENLGLTPAFYSLSYQGEKLEESLELYPGIIYREYITKFRATVADIGCSPIGYRQDNFNGTTYFIWKDKDN